MQGLFMYIKCLIRTLDVTFQSDREKGTRGCAWLSSQKCAHHMFIMIHEITNILLFVPAKNNLHSDVL